MSEQARSIEVRTLGLFEVRSHGVLLTRDTTRSHKMWDLFKYLVTQRNRAVPAETLIDMLWPEVDYDDPKHALRTLVYRLRKTLARGDAAYNGISSVGTGYMFTLCDNCWLDAAAFEQLTAIGRISGDIEPLLQAMSLYQGDYLSDSVYTEWAIAKRSFYRRMFIDSACELLRLLRQADRLQEADRVCHQALAIEPLDEEVNAKYLELLFVGGHYTRAQEHYAQYTARLYRELGVSPSPKLKGVYEQFKADSQAASPQGKSSPKEEGAEAALICASDVFASLSELEGRRGARNGYGVYVAEFVLSGQRVSEVQQETAVTVLAEAMRKGDAVAAQANSRIDALLTNLSEEHLIRVLSRLEQHLKVWASPLGISVNGTYRPIAP